MLFYRLENVEQHNLHPDKTSFTSYLRKMAVANLVISSFLFAVVAYSGMFLAIQPSICHKKVDVVITIHNALAVVQHTLQVLEGTEIRGRTTSFTCAEIYLVDSASDSLTAEFLVSKSAEYHSHFKYHYLRRNSSSYTSAVNAGVLAGIERTIIILNSDVILPYSWLSNLEHLLYTAQNIGMVGPLSNSACYQSVPLVTPQSWSENNLPDGLTVQHVNNFLKDRRHSDSPSVPLLNGFVLALKRDVVDTIGVFDERAFPEGYGEENDYCYRARRAGYSLRVAETTYVYHLKSASFGVERRRALVQNASKSYSGLFKNYIRLAHEELMHEGFLKKARKETEVFISDFLFSRQVRHINP